MKELIRHIIREETGRIIWDYERTKELAKTVSSRAQLKSKNQSAYQNARINGWLDEFFPKKTEEEKEKEEYDRVKKESQKYKSRDDFHKGAPWLYNVARTKGWLDELIPLSEKTYNQSSTEEFINKAKKVHGDKYEYDKVNYVQARKTVIVTCPEHGDFPITPDNHLRGKGCKECGKINAGLKTRSNTNDFIEKSKRVHTIPYDYSRVNYETNSTDVEIICPIHNKIFLQTPQNHLAGKGCPICQESHGERMVSKILETNNIDYETQKKFDDCINISTKKICRKLPFDFYIDSLRTCIEFDGEQHFRPINKFGGIESYEKLKKRDKIKNQYCEENGIKLIRIPYTMNKKDIEPYILQELGLKLNPHSNGGGFYIVENV